MRTENTYLVKQCFNLSLLMLAKKYYPDLFISSSYPRSPSNPFGHSQPLSFTPCYPQSHAITLSHSHSPPAILSHTLPLSATLIHPLLSSVTRYHSQPLSFIPCYPHSHATTLSHSRLLSTILSDVGQLIVCTQAGGRHYDEPDSTRLLQ